MKLKTLSILTGVLFAISIVVHINENKRGTDLLEGSDYIKGLDVGKVQKIALTFKDNKKLVLTRDSGRFVLESHKSYPAASDKVNDLIYQIASIQVKEKVLSDSGEGDFKKYELDEKSRHCLVELFDNDGKKTVSFSVGKSYKGKGRYLFKEDSKEIYLSQSGLQIPSSHKDFVDTMLLDIKRDDIEKISIRGGTQIDLAKQDQSFVVESPKNKKFKKEKAEEYAKSFTSLKFDEFYSHSGPSVQSLQFRRDIKIQLKNRIIYHLKLASNKSDYYVKLNALMNEVPRQIVINKDDGKDKLQNVENIIKAQGTAQRFNQEKASWVYKIDKTVYEKIVKDSTFFL